MGLGAKKTRTKTRRFTRAVDQSKSDLLDARHLEIYKETKLVEDLPSLGEWYCIECSRWFDTESTLVGHKRGKPHKRRAKECENPYTQKEAEAAVGLRTDTGRPRAQKDVDMKEVEMTA